MILDTDRIKKRNTLVDLMIEVHGRDYTFGWLMSMYIKGSVSNDFEDAIADRTLEDLLARKSSNDDANCAHAIGYHDE